MGRVGQASFDRDGERNILGVELPYASNDEDEKEWKDRVSHRLQATPELSPEADPEAVEVPAGRMVQPEADPRVELGVVAQ